MNEPLAIQGLFDIEWKLEGIDPERVAADPGWHWSALEALHRKMCIGVPLGGFHGQLAARIVLDLGCRTQIVTWSRRNARNVAKLCFRQVQPIIFGNDLLRRLFIHGLARFEIEHLHHVRVYSDFHIAGEKDLIQSYYHGSVRHDPTLSLVFQALVPFSTLIIPK
jgi:hypothetical protein